MTISHPAKPFGIVNDAPTTVTFRGLALSPIWADHGATVFGIDSVRQPVLQPVDGAPAQRLAEAARIPDSLVRGGIATRSSDGHTLYVAYLVQSQLHGAIYALRLPGGATREVVRFDEPSRPYIPGSTTMAEFGGWLYFTLYDPESDIWVATVKGLKQ